MDTLQARLAQFTATQIADKTGVTQQAASRWQNGQGLPSPAHWLRLSRLMKCPKADVEELVNDAKARKRAARIRSRHERSVA